MIIFPNANPVVKRLNSYYIDMERLIEHYQGDLGTGAIYLESEAAEGIVFFDEEEITNVFFEEAGNFLEGTAARDELIRNLARRNFRISVYEIEADKFHYWTNLWYAKPLYRDLDSETMGLEELLRQMNSESLTGFIDIAFAPPADRGLVFFYNGNIIGTSSLEKPDEATDTKQALQGLILKSKESKTIFNVKRLDLFPAPQKEDADADGTPTAGEVIALLQALLSNLESLIAAEKRIKTDFDTLLKKKFFEKADIYEFLDPFAAEVRYADGVLELTGDNPLPQIVKGVWESAVELADDMGLSALLLQRLQPLKERYRSEIAYFGISI